MNHVHIWGGNVGGEKRGQERRGQKRRQEDRRGEKDIPLVPGCKDPVPPESFP